MTGSWPGFYGHPGNRSNMGSRRPNKKNEPQIRLSDPSDSATERRIHRRGGPRLCWSKEACKPSSVSEMPLVYAPTNRSLLPMAGPAATIYLGPSLPAGSSGQPGDRPDALFPLFGLAPDGVCLASDVTTRAVSSYLAFSPLPRRVGAVCFCGTFRRVTPPRR